jgi:uncharacterized cysteine cluster protein YcgN (CxxCxxCC family)
MDREFIIREVDEQEIWKFNKINQLDPEEWERRCIRCNDCSICDMAIHQPLITKTKHTCVYGMTEKEFRSHMTDVDAYF